MTDQLSHDQVSRIMTDRGDTISPGHVARIEHQALRKMRRALLADIDFVIAFNLEDYRELEAQRDTDCTRQNHAQDGRPS